MTSPVSTKFIRSAASSSTALVCSLVLHGCGGTSSKPPAVPEAARHAPASTPLAESARALTGRWHCSGAIYGADGAASPSQVTLDVELDLDSAWLRTEFAVSSGKYGYGFKSYRTFDSSSKKWSNVIVDNMGGHAVSSSIDGVTWIGESHGPMGKMEIRDTETLTSPSALTLLGQYSLDTRSWSTGYDLSCSK